MVLRFFQTKDPQNRVQENKYKKKFIFFPLKFGSAVINTKLQQVTYTNEQLDVCVLQALLLQD